jgi:type I restriction enzyme S subunit
MVEWKTLGDIMTIVRGASPRPIKNYITDSKEGINWIKIGDVSPDAKYITKANERITKEGAEKSRFLHEGDFILSNSMSFGRPYILKIDGCIHDGWIAMSDFEKHVSPGYLYEILNSNGVQDYWKMKANNGGAMTNLNSDIVRSTIIPIPSLSEQTRIVGILDTFTSAIDNLKEQIAQRRKQYEYYRDQLLDLEGKEGVEMIKLGDICFIKNGYTPSTKNPEFWEGGSLPWFTLDDIRKNGRILTDAIKHITATGVKKSGLFPKESIIISTTATIGEFALINTDFLCNQQITSLSIKAIYKDQLLAKFLYYLSDGIGKWCKKNVNGGGSLLIVSTSKLNNYVIPVPSLSEQQRIVSILDTFEASIQNLEAQLKEREKQYEYYRNKLLTFE